MASPGSVGWPASPLPSLTASTQGDSRRLPAGLGWPEAGGGRRPGSRPGTGQTQAQPANGQQLAAPPLAAAPQVAAPQVAAVPQVAAEGQTAAAPPLRVRQAVPTAVSRETNAHPAEAGRAGYGEAMSTVAQPARTSSSRSAEGPAATDAAGQQGAVQHGIAPPA